jgi:TetR/AcrR family transcriptional repressor of nem operon
MKVAPQEAVQAVMGLFWRDGYNCLSTRAIETDAGITRFTLQSTYGGKMALFLQALDTYLEMFQTYGLPSKDAESLEGLVEWFEDRADPKMFGDQACFGCLLLNTLVEFGGTNAEVNKRADRYFGLIRDRFRLVLETLKDQGVLQAGFDVEANADVLVSLAIGMNVIVRAYGQNNAAGASSAAAASLIRSWAA